MVKQPDQQQMTPLEQMNLQQLGMRIARQTEMELRAERATTATGGYTGALILGRAAWCAYDSLREAKARSPYRNFRQVAHAILAEALDDVELMMTKTEGRA